MAKRKPPRPGWEEIPYKPGHWLDFSGGKVCIREADGTLVATDLHITEEDAARVKREWRAYLAEAVAKAKREPEA